jgi:1-acyl-sn-glycerol-3-phosphate acyltransferase
MHGLYDRLLVLALNVLAPLAMLFVLVHVLWGLIVAALLFPVLPAPASDALVRFWSRILLVALGIRLELPVAPSAPEPGTGALLVMNHVSWADVFVLTAVVPVRFVAKAEIARWPLLGRFAAAVGTVFVERGRRHAVSDVNRVVAERLRAGQSIGIFPEGTTTDGSRVLRFHANLIQAALDAKAPVVPVALDYRQDGRASTAAAFIGEMTLVESLWRVLVTPRLTARLHWLPEIDCAGLSRQAVARGARAAVGAALGLPDADANTPATDASADEAEQSEEVGSFGPASLVGDAPRSTKL